MKGAARKEVFTWWALLCGSILYLPVLLLSGPVPARVWPLAAASALVEVLYYLALGRAYDQGDFSFVYPIARGAAPALLTVWAILFLGERPRPAGLLGLATLVAGLGLVGGVHRRLRPGGRGETGRRDDRENGRRGRVTGGLAAALGVALCISIYSAIDGAAVHRMSPAGYTVLVLGLTCAFLTPVVVARHGVGTLLSEWRRYRGRILAVGVMTLLAYILVLEAYARARVSYAGALREISIVLAALAGWAFLKEELGASRLAGAMLAFAGVLLIALAG